MKLSAIPNRYLRRFFRAIGIRLRRCRFFGAIMKTVNTISGPFDRAKLDRLKAEYQKAVNANSAEFPFEGNTLLVSFAKYLIEYLETVL